MSPVLLMISGEWLDVQYEFGVSVQVMCHGLDSILLLLTIRLSHAIIRNTLL